MGAARHIQGIVDACVGMGRYQPHELLRWLVADVLASFGVRTEDRGRKTCLRGCATRPVSTPARLPEHPSRTCWAMSIRRWLRAGTRAAWASSSRLGPSPSSWPGCAVQVSCPSPTEPDRLLRMCEPACGSAALVLGFMRSVQERQGAQGLRRWAITCLDLDHLCTHICAAQVLSNLFVGRLSLGELVVYQGNALAPAECLSVVVHASLPNLPPDVELPALHPSRLFALREAAPASCPPGFDGAAAHEERTDHECKAAVANVQLGSKDAERRRVAGQRGATPVGAEAQADLFGD